MRKKEKRAQIINNIQELNLEIDYDKLAESIRKAQNKADAQSAKKSTSKFRSMAMSFFNGATYATVYIFSGLCIYNIWSKSYTKQSAPLIGCIILTIILSFVGIYAFMCQQESFQDKDNDIREIFNTNISLLALIIAVIALFKEVG